MKLSRKSGLAILKRWLKFNTVGAMGIGVQLMGVYLFGSVLDANSVAATALGVEAAVLHNFVWHEHLTWADRQALTRRRLLLRLLAFNATTGAVSIAGNLCIVWLLIGQMQLGLLAANLCAVSACSLTNFAINDRIIFRAAGKAASTADSC